MSISTYIADEPPVMLSVGDIMSQFREQFKQEVEKLQKDNKELRTSAFQILSSPARVESV